jgi:glycosyltransferase involved in cell wall biosynthesis
VRIIAFANALEEEPTGLCIYTMNIIRHLSKIHKELEVHTPFVQMFGKMKTKKTSTLMSASKKEISFLMRTLYGTTLSLKNTVLFSPSHLEINYLRKVPQVVTIHDIIPYLYPRYHPRWYFFFKYILSPFLRRENVRVIVPSRCTKEDLVRHLNTLPEKVHIIHEGVEEIFHRRKKDEIEKVCKRYRISPPYILYVGRIAPSKNVRRLLSAFSLIKNKRLTLVVAGKGSKRDMGCGNERVKMISYVRREELPALYSGALFFVFPSLYEGFGLPPLEACACGCSVLASSVPAIKEVLKDAALYVEPESVESIAEGMKQMVEDEGLRDKLKRKGERRVREFSWSKAAEQTLRVLRKAYEDFTHKET